MQEYETEESKEVLKLIFEHRTEIKQTKRSCVYIDVRVYTWPFSIARRSEEAASGRFCRFKIIKASDHTNPELFCYLKLLFI